MQRLSVVIVCRNEAAIIGKTLESLFGLTDDIVVYDSGSIDGTREIAKAKGGRLFPGEWQGFGLTKQKATELAQYDWILSLDADECVSNDLRSELLALDLSDEKIVYELRFKNFFGNKPLRFGEWGGDKHIRLFNRKQVQWNDAPIHESLLIPGGIKKITLKGHVLHYTARDIGAYARKLEGYAALHAEKYGRSRKTGWALQILAPGFSFLNNYILRGGFLDGREGFQCARMSARYTYLKYAKLQKLKRG